MLVLVGRTDLPGGAEAGLAQAGLRGDGVAPRVGGAEAGLGCPSGSRLGDESSRDFIAPLFSLVCMGVHSAQSGWGSSESSEPPGPSGSQSAASAPPARG